MEFLDFDHVSAPVLVRASRFRGADGVEEYHVMIRPVEDGDVGNQLEWIRRAASETTACLGLREDTAVLRRFFCSDLPNQAPALDASPISSRRARSASCAVSWVSQPPVPSAKVALWAYHVNDPDRVLDRVGHNGTLTLNRGELRHQWTTGLVSPGGQTAYDQTRGVFRRYSEMLDEQNLRVADHVLRTWLFVRNIDTNYRGMVAARREFFVENGLTPETHFIASSGIEGSAADVGVTVSMDAYAIGGVRPEQISYLSALDHLGPTHTYGVTFERATSIAYRDRRHVILSGTASIDSDGRIVHTGDVSRQLARTLDNMEALLDQAGATLGDVGSFIVYVRDPSDHAVAWEGMRERVGGAPVQVVHAQVCRPGWLVEVEGTAVLAADNPELPAF